MGSLEPPKADRLRTLLRAVTRRRGIVVSVYLAVIAGSLALAYRIERETFYAVIICSLAGLTVAFLAAGWRRLNEPISPVRFCLPLLLAALTLAAGVNEPFYLTIPAKHLVQPGPYLALELVFLADSTVIFVLFWRLIRRRGFNRIECLAYLVLWSLPISLLRTLAAGGRLLLTGYAPMDYSHVLHEICLLTGAMAAAFWISFSLYVLYLLPFENQDLLKNYYHCRKCGYDLRGTVHAGRDRCPECGQLWRHELPADRRPPLTITPST